MPLKRDPTIQTYIIDFPKADWQHIKTLASLREKSVKALLYDIIDGARRKVERGRDRPEPSPRKQTLATKLQGKTKPKKGERLTTPYLIEYPADEWPHVKAAAAVSANSMRQFIQDAVYAELEEADRAGELRVRVV